MTGAHLRISFIWRPVERFHELGSVTAACALYPALLCARRPGSSRATAAPGVAGAHWLKQHCMYPEEDPAVSALVGRHPAEARSRMPAAARTASPRLDRRRLSWPGCAGDFVLFERHAKRHARHHLGGGGIHLGSNIDRGRGLFRQKHLRIQRGGLDASTLWRWRRAAEAIPRRNSASSEVHSCQRWYLYDGSAGSRTSYPPHFKTRRCLPFRQSSALGIRTVCALASEIPCACPCRTRSS